VIARALALVVFAVLGLAGCARTLPARAVAHGNFLAATSERPAKKRTDESALVVLVERTRVVAIDPLQAQVRWTLPVVVTGQIVASATTVYLPARGQQLVAVDRKTGIERFHTQLPGEALTGLAVSEPWIVATVLDPSAKTRSRIVGISSEDGDVRWQRRSPTRLGIPDVVGSVAVLPVGDQVAALRLDSGREVARLDVAAALERDVALERVTHRHGMWFVGSDARWVRLGVPGSRGEAQQLSRTYAQAFRTVEGIDVGHGDGERLRLWVRMSNIDETPRDAILLSRRAVVALRLDTEGLPVRARWVHTERKGELVAMEVVDDRVVLVREDGAILRLADDDGRILDRIEGDEPVRGAVILGPAPRKHGNMRRSDDPDALADLYDLLLESDPRLLPAQRLAADLLWRHDDPRVRRVVRELADGELRSDDAPETLVLRDHAIELVGTRWGGGSSKEVEAVIAALRKRPAFGDEAGLELAIRDALRTGRPSLVHELTALLLHPGTSADDLVRIVDALALLGDPAAVDGVATFLRRYHADESIVKESPVLFSAAKLLLRHAERDTPEGSAARTALWAVADDPLCEPHLQALVAARLRALPAAHGGDANVVADSK
jgi:outer membrane protein assembly factor BamB